VQYRNIKKGLESYTGIHRRFELKGIENNIKVVDDYAHHPSEIKATLKAARSGNYPRIWTVFQPHTYTRTKFLLMNSPKPSKIRIKLLLQTSTPPGKKTPVKYIQGFLRKRYGKTVRMPYIFPTLKNR